MNRVHLEYSLSLDKWLACVGDAEFAGTRDDCLRWLAERYCEAKNLTQDIRRELRLLRWEEIPYAFAPGEE